MNPLRYAGFEVQGLHPALAIASSSRPLGRPPPDRAQDRAVMGHHYPAGKGDQLGIAKGLQTQHGLVVYVHVLPW